MAETAAKIPWRTQHGQPEIIVKKDPKEPPTIGEWIKAGGMAAPWLLQMIATRGYEISPWMKSDKRRELAEETRAFLKDKLQTGDKNFAPHVEWLGMIPDLEELPFGERVRQIRVFDEKWFWGQGASFRHPEIGLEFMDQSLPAAIEVSHGDYLHVKRMLGIPTMADLLTVATQRRPSTGWALRKSLLLHPVIRKLQKLGQRQTNGSPAVGIEGPGKCDGAVRIVDSGPRKSTIGVFIDVVGQEDLERSAKEALAATGQTEVAIFRLSQDPCENSRLIEEHKKNGSRAIGILGGIDPEGWLPLEDGILDAGGSNYVVHHGTNPARMIAEMARVCQRGLFADGIDDRPTFQALNEPLMAAAGAWYTHIDGILSHVRGWNLERSQEIAEEANSLLAKDGKKPIRFKAAYFGGPEKAVEVPIIGPVIKSQQVALSF